MKHTHLFLILAAALTLCACEKPTDDRQHETPSGTVYHAYLLNAQVTAIPQNGAYYECHIAGTNFDPRQLYTANLPEMYRISGGRMIDNEYHGLPATVTVLKLDSLNAIPDTLIYNYEIPCFSILNDTLHRPQYLDHAENGFALKMEFRYD